MQSWQVEFVSPEAEAEVDALPVEVRARFERICGLIAEFGLEHLREPYVKHLQGKLWEMRMKGRDGIGRSLYVAAAERRVVVLLSFIKKTQKTPPREVRLALGRAKELE